jgi:hypothetical protein
MKIGAVSLVYNEQALVKGCIRSLKPFVDRHIMAVGTKPYYGQEEPLDQSAVVAHDEGAEVICGQWKLDHHQRNSALEMFDDSYDWILTTDVDMWLEHNTVRNLLDILSKSSMEVACVSQYSYWKDTDHILEGDDFMPVIAVRPHIRFHHIGNVKAPYYPITDIKIHHLAWCAPKDIYKKVLTYPHAPEFDGEKWYDQYYLGWHDGMKAVLPNKRFNVKYQPLPAELKEYLQ